MKKIEASAQVLTTIRANLFLDVISENDDTLTIRAFDDEGHDFEFEVSRDDWEEDGYSLEDTINEEFGRYMDNLATSEWSMGEY